MNSTPFFKIGSGFNINVDSLNFNTLNTGFIYLGATGSAGIKQVGTNELASNIHVSGVPTVDTATSGTNTTQIANTAFVQTAIANLDIHGVTGTQGFNGATGAQGLHGATGAQGFNGATGAQGFNGATGAQGFNGATGAQGLQGTGFKVFMSGTTINSTITNLFYDSNSGLHIGEFFLMTGGRMYCYLPGTSANETTGDLVDFKYSGDVTDEAILIGPQGATGAQGLQGDQGLQGLQGATGVISSLVPVSQVNPDDASLRYLLMVDGATATNQQIRYDYTASGNTGTISYRPDTGQLNSRIINATSHVTSPTMFASGYVYAGRVQLSGTGVTSSISLIGGIKTISNSEGTGTDSSPTVPIILQTNQSNSGGLVLQTLGATGSSAPINFNTGSGSQGTMRFNPQGSNALTIGSTGVSTFANNVVINSASTLIVQGGHRFSIGTPITGTITLTTPLAQFYTYSTTVGSYTITLPAPSAAIAGSHFILRGVASASSPSGTVTVNSTGTVMVKVDTIVLSTSVNISGAGTFDNNSFICDGTYWYQGW